VIGRTISHYKITEKLGQGGMGVVYKAEDTQLRIPVALKFLSRDVLGDEEVENRLIREAQTAASLDHPNICRVYGVNQEDEQTFIAMAFVDGPSLDAKIKERRLPLDEALDIAVQAGEGLQEAHEAGVVHRDIKPHNIMLTAKGQVKIMDFGLAQLSGRSRLTKPGTTLGTRPYMAPEQLLGEETDQRSDIWALGVVLYEMLAQRLPFEADYDQSDRLRHSQRRARGTDSPTKRSTAGNRPSDLQGIGQGTGGAISDHWRYARRSAATQEEVRNPKVGCNNQARVSTASIGQVSRHRER